MKKFFSSLRLPTVGALLFALVALVLLTPVVGSEGAAVFSVLSIVAACTPLPTGVFGLNNTNNASARDSYNMAKRMFWKAFRDKFQPGPQGDKDCQDFVDQLKLSQGEIRLEVKLDTNNSQFVFGVTPNQANTNNTQFVTENRLPLQDSICVNEYGIYVALPASDTDTEYLLRSYGNTVDFTAAGAKALDGGFFSNGGFSLKCNNDVLVPYRSLLNHWYKPQTQQTAALGAASPGDQIRGAEDGSITDEPNIVIIGSKNTIPQINLKSRLSTVDAGTRAILLLRGIYAQNSTVVS